MTFEIKIIESLQRNRNGFFDTFFSGYAWLASVWAVLVLGVVCFIFYDKKVGVAFVITEGFAFLSTFVLKRIIQRPRPFVVSSTILNLGHESGYSLPSGHLTCAIVICIFLFFIAFRSCKYKGRIIIGVFAVLYVLLMILDRMYLGVHYLTDTFAGIAVGAIWCGVSLIALPPLGRVWDRVWEKLVKKHKEHNQKKNKEEVSD